MQKEKWKYYPQLHKQISGRKIKILIVGAGGIGCQLVKNLYKSAFDITIIDNDTISQTNLNRQFCFGKQDVGKYKVDVLFTYFNKIYPQLKIKTQKDNLFQFDSLYFSQFDVLISALDNSSARNYLNLMAIDHCIPMIDAGTAGYNGQSYIFQRFVTECRMCRPQAIQQESFAVCSIRGTPQRNIHCIHFALNLCKFIIGLRKHDLPKLEQTVNSVQLQDLLKNLIVLKKDANASEIYEMCIKIHNKIFLQVPNQNKEQQIQKIQYKNQTNLKKIKNILQKSLKRSIVLDNQQDLLIFLQNTQNQEILYQKQFPIQYYSFLFVRFLVMLLFNQGLQSYDKDSFICAFFIFCATNLRIGNFKHLKNSKLQHISYYKCKDQSGRIIPAIASTNSIAASLQTLLLHKKVQNKSTDNSSTLQSYLSIKGYTNDYKVEQYTCHKPKVCCPYCSRLYNYVQLYADMGAVTWGELEEFLVDGFGSDLGSRDMRCEEFVVIRNAGKRVWRANRDKLLTGIPKLVQVSKTGLSTITVRYSPFQQVDTMVDFPTIWKFVIIHRQSQGYENRIQIKKGLTKQEYQRMKQQEIIKLNQLKINNEKMKKLMEQQAQALQQIQDCVTTCDIIQ